MPGRCFRLAGLGEGARVWRAALLCWFSVEALGCEASAYLLLSSMNRRNVAVDEVGDVSSSLSICQGDCDSDSQCEGSLKCFKRDEGGSSGNKGALIPGCVGEYGLGVHLNMALKAPTYETASKMQSALTT